MKKVISTERIPIKLWLDDMEDPTLEQAKNLASLPFAFKHVAIMPDSHLGYGMPIGGVLATKGVVIPNAVGVDIGCGMCAVKTPLTEIDTNTLKNIMGKIRQQIPVGFNRHKVWKYVDIETDLEYVPLICMEHSKTAMESLGTLGGGNHFIEIQKGSDGYIWIMVHSGSRNLGKQVADHYNKIAVSLNEKWHSKVPKEWGLAFLPIDSSEGQDYLQEMQYCVDFAFANRRLMMDRVGEIFGIELQIDKNKPWETINIAHNYAAMENHYGENVMVHRKGATQARLGQFGIIPGSQGTKSYIVSGIGNKPSFESCSHGAGRKMGRKQAIKELDLEAEQNLLNSQGVIHSIRNVKDLDEAPSAYKDIDVVMENQKDLVDIVVELRPLAVIKG